MAHEVKRSKASNNVFSSDQPSSSSCGHPCSSWTNSTDNNTELCVLGISPVEQVFGIDWVSYLIISSLFLLTVINTDIHNHEFK